MTGQRRSCVISLLCLFAMYVSAGEDQSLVINADNFLCRLRGNINLCKEYREGKKTREYAYFRLAGKYMKVGDFCKLYQSLCSSSKPGDMVSIITIRSKNVKKSHEPKKYMENFTKAIQEFVNQNEGYVSVASLGLKVGYFELKSLGDYDLVNEHFSRICNIRRRCEELVIENAYALCFDAFTGIFFSKIEKSILSYRVTRNSLEEENKIFLDIKNGDYKLFDDIKELSLHNCLYGNLSFMNSGKDSAFGRIYLSICCHEDKLQYEYFTNKQDRFDDFLKTLIKNQYRELFEQIFNDMALSYIPISEMKRNEEAFRKFFVDIYVRHLDNCRVNQTFANDDGYGKQFDHFMKSNNFRAQFRDMFRSFLQYEGSDITNDTYKAKTEKILQEIQSEQITTIVYNRQIDSESMYHLCEIIGNRKALDGSYKQQYIYLEDGKAITQEEAKECCDACDKITIESGDKEQLVEFYPIKKGVNEDDVESRNYTYLRHKAVADYTRSVSYTASPTNPKETVITIDAFDKTGLVVASKEKTQKFDCCVFSKRSL